MLRDTAKTASLSSEKGARFCLCPFAVSNACKNAPSHEPLSRTSLTPAQRPKTPLSSLQCETLRPLSKRSTRDRACGVGHAASLPKRARSHGYHRLAHRRLIPPPSASFPPHDLSRGHADLLCLLLLDRLLAACRAVDFLRLSLTSDRRVFLGGDPTYFPRACASGDLQKKPSPFTTDHKHLIQNHLWVKASPYFPFTFTFTHCHYEPSRSDPRRSMYEKRIKNKVAKRQVKARVKAKRG